MMKDVFDDFLLFLVSPKREIKENLRFIEKMRKIVPLFFMIFVFIIVIVAPLMTLIGAEDIPNKIEDLKNLGFESAWANNLAIFGLAVIIAPFFEEIIFRFPLKFRIGSILLAGAAIGLVGYSIISFLGFETVYSLSIACFLSLAFIIVFLLTNKKPEDLSNSVRKWFPYFFYAATFLFALAHIANYELPGSKWYLTPILVLPQFILGLMLGYVRLKYGLLASMLVHAMNNFIPSIALMFLSES